MSAICKVLQVFWSCIRALGWKHGHSQRSARTLERGNNLRKYLAIVLLLLSSVTCAYAQVPGDVPTDHWAYQAVDQLIARGYLGGYPDGLFHGDKAISRYEFATITKRILDEVNARMTAIETKAATPTVTTVTPVTPSVTPEDLEAVKKLVGEFKVELTVIGTRLDNIDNSLAEFKTKLETIDAILTDPEGPFETAKTDIAKLKTIGFSGYLQLLYTSKDNGTKGKAETFNMRRARFKLTAKPTEKSTFVTELDASGDTTVTKDAYLQYAFDGDPALGLTLSAGQMIVPFGNELLVSSSLRETPEYALVIQRFFPGERDRGFKLAGATKSNFRWQLGAFNGNGAVSKADVNTQKDLAGTVKTTFGNLELGISGYKGFAYTDGSAAAAVHKKDKTRYGIDAQLYLDGMTIKGEYIAGKGVEGAVRDFDETVKGCWAQIAKNIDVKNVLVVKYDGLSDDNKSAKDYGKLSTWNYGIVHYLDDATRFKIFYQINNEAKNAYDNNGIVAEFITKF